MGGDEFAIVVTDAQSRKLVEQLADRIIKAVKEPYMVDQTEIRIGVSIGVLAPMAFMMGMPFSIGMRMASTDEGSPTAFLWGINGAMSVVSSVFATVIALFFGIYFTFAAGIASYVLAAGSMYVLVLRLEASGSTAVAAANGSEPEVSTGAGDAAGDGSGDDEGDEPTEAGELTPAAT